MKKIYKSVRETALKDISDHLKTHADYDNERIYFVGQRYIDTKDTNRLNRDLGLNKLNYGRYHKRKKDMRTIDKIINKVDCKYGAPMGRLNTGDLPNDKKIYDCYVPMNGAYDKGGVYWGLGAPLRVSYTKDLKYINFYRS